MNPPPLPPTSGTLFEFRTRKNPFTYYTTDDMREYGALCYRQALEEAIQVCKNLDAMSRDPMVAWGSADECAEAIEELLK